MQDQNEDEEMMRECQFCFHKLVSSSVYRKQHNETAV